MAVTNYALAGVSDETQRRLQQAQQAYQQSAAVTAAQQNLANAQAAKPGSYTASADVNAAKQNLQAAQAAKPGAYTASNAVTQAQKNLQAAQAAKPGSYQQSAAVTQAQKNLQAQQAAKPGEYKESGAVTAAWNTLNQLQANKPQSYNSKYAGTLESILQQITNPEKFKYEFNGDNLFKAYSDLYTQQGKQAALDAQGQAAALTGGYGNSYGQALGQQQYQQFLTQLFDRGLELRNAAYNQYLDEQNALKDRYNVLKGADESDYNRYRDTVGDWREDVDYATNRYNTERSFDYNKYQDTYQNWKDQQNYLTDVYNTERSIDYNKYRDLVGDYNTNLNYLTNVYNNERNIDYSRYRDVYGDWQTAEEQAYNRAKDAEQMDYEKYQLDREYWTGLAQIENKAYASEQDRQEAIRQFNLEMEYKQDEFKYKWGLNQPAVVEEAPAATPYTPSPSPKPEPEEEKPKATASWLTTTGNKIAAAKATQKAQEDGKKLTERYKNKK